ncbi:MAG: FecR family protein [Candidatus Omnitrophota bacterium]
MKCATVKKELLAWAVDRPGESPPAVCRDHIAQCGNCAKEWTRLQKWAILLRSKEEWTPEEGFFERLTANAMREKNRAALTESTRRDLSLDSSGGLFAFLRTPLQRRWIFAGAVFAILLPLAFIAYGSYDAIGQIDYAGGLVFNQTAFSKEIRKEDVVSRGTAIQTAADAESIVRLKGGSEVFVDSRSRVAFVDNRTVRLELGRAYFDVAPNRKPFEITTPNGAIAVLGTAFAVDVNGDETVVTVTRGTVQLSNSAGLVRIAKGGEGIANQNKQPILREAQRMNQTIKWISSLLEKRNEEDLRTYYPSLAPPRPRMRQVK